MRLSALVFLDTILILWFLRNVLYDIIYRLYDLDAYFHTYIPTR